MSSDTPAAPLRISRLQETNFKRISSLDISPGARTLIVLQGANENGKTSAIDGIIAALAGKKAAPELPIRRGEETAIIDVELSDDLRPRYQVQRWFKGDRTGLHVYEFAEDGTRLPVRAQQSVLDSLVSDVSFNPLEFAKADRKSQVRMLCGAIGRPDLIEKAEQRKAAVAEQRRQINAKAAGLKAELSNGLADPAPGQDLHEVTAAGVQERLDAANRQNQARRAKTEEIAAFDAEVGKAQGQVATIDQQIADLQRRREQWVQYQAAKQAAAVQARDELKALPPEVSTAEITAQLAQVEADNAKARRQKQHREKAAEFQRLQAQADELTQQLATIDTDVETVIGASNLGQAVPGLAFRGGELFHDNVPFSQASGMRRLELSALIGMASNPRLRILCIDEGDQLDDASLQRLKELAKARGYSVWMTAIRAGDETDADTCLIKVVDGVAGNAAASAGPDAPVAASAAAPVAVPMDLDL